ncbi:hypothetical protein MADA3029_900101 [Vibrio nigripulchritudo MADA3029]|uniref:hypothetical protein n=2 Tax=Vibrio nigripulchritudo TaxID=28173 RepID=UPI0003B1C0E9|nr:hypothetical protein [Vibrio nigripulchritudo]CCN33251.1 hypothetical protein VIBNIAM115_1190038 [Vibrio nigripulchritudo AM115]CCN45344.1 hypothetical protein VIBNIMADA3020_1040064 [Vibrio nigripulchritudo MADA3020]CCN51792.1 hypothetical protein VIBNIMADA3021_1160100 [Vibrio nigripulchritudo MADA3021]CCN61956.1 hypothetical protein MADA3029_900101 [Vibrio nigripulchritudo MADA3029]CCN65918.1 hypothetical protein VIBNIPon4_470061 [Vibrio nigripulchritudo POn4]
MSDKDKRHSREGEGTMNTENLGKIIDAIEHMDTHEVEIVSRAIRKMRDNSNSKSEIRNSLITDEEIRYIADVFYSNK